MDLAAPSPMSSLRWMAFGPRSCRSRARGRLNPADEPPTKRRRAGEDVRRDPEVAVSLEEKEDINDMLLRLVTPGRDAHKVIPLPDSILRVLQENQTTGHGGEDGELEIDVYDLSDDALRVIKNSVGGYLADSARRHEIKKQVVAKNEIKKEVVAKNARAPTTSIGPSVPATTKKAPCGGKSSMKLIPVAGQAAERLRPLKEIERDERALSQIKIEVVTKNTATSIPPPLPAPIKKDVFTKSIPPTSTSSCRNNSNIDDQDAFK